jgi:hypothetical protein
MPNRGTLKFKSPVAYQLTAIYGLGLNKIPANVDTLLATCIEGLRLFQEFTA